MLPHPSPLEEAFLRGLFLEHNQHATFAEFLRACQSNDAKLALQLSSDQEPAALTWGLNHAVIQLHLDLARQLLLNGVEWDPQTVLYASNSLDSIKLLFDFGYSVNSTVLGGERLLLKVVERNDETAIRFLLAHGANPNLGPSRSANRHLPNIRADFHAGHTLNQAAEICRPEIFALLLQHGGVLSNSIALHRAAGVPPTVPPGERIPMLEYLVGLGLDVNSMDDAIKITDDGRGRHGSPLHYAVRWRRTEEIKWLLDHGADPDNKPAWGPSARERANQLPAEDEVSIILKAASPIRH